MHRLISPSDPTPFWFCQFCQFVVAKVSLNVSFLLALCRSKAEGVKDLANNTKHALDMTEKAVKKARKALNEAHNNLNSTRNATSEVLQVVKMAVGLRKLVCGNYLYRMFRIFSQLPQLPTYKVFYRLTKKSTLFHFHLMFGLFYVSFTSR